MAKKKEWWKTKPYPHLTKKVGHQNQKYVSEEEVKSFQNHIINLFNSGTYNFFPLLRYVKKERRYKKVQCKLDELDYYYLVNDKNKYIRKVSNKERIIEYATHIDTQIYAYLGHLLYEQYEKKLEQHPNIKQSIIGYRRIENKQGNGANNIDLAYEFFDKILEYGQDAYVLTFDIKDFFPSLNHKILFDAWGNLYDRKDLSKEDYHVFRAITKYAYINKDDIRKKLHKSQSEAERALRKNIEQGIDAYFATPKEMRKAIRSGELPIYKNKEKGIPHGLPVSATLANIYMWDFDESISQLVYGNGGHYRRYSDDIIILIPKDDDLKKCIKNKVKTELFDKLKLELSHGKTEEYSILHQGNDVKVQGIVKVKKYNSCTQKCPMKENDIRTKECQKEKVFEKTRYSLHYLGLELFGKKEDEKLIYIKQTTLAKFQNKMRNTVHRYIKRAYIRAERDCMPVPEIFYNDLRRKFTFRGMKKGKTYKKGEDSNQKKCQKGEVCRKSKYFKWQYSRGVYDYAIKKVPTKINFGSTLSYARKFDKCVYESSKRENGKGQKQFRKMKNLLFREIKKAKDKYKK